MSQHHKNTSLQLFLWGPLRDCLCVDLRIQSFLRSNTPFEPSRLCFVSSVSSTPYRSRSVVNLHHQDTETDEATMVLPPADYCDAAQHNSVKNSITSSNTATANRNHQHSPTPSAASSSSDHITVSRQHHQPVASFIRRFPSFCSSSTQVFQNLEVIDSLKHIQTGGWVTLKWFRVSAGVSTNTFLCVCFHRPSLSALTVLFSPERLWALTFGPEFPERR